MEVLTLKPHARTPTADELRHLSREERNRILSAAAALAEKYYLPDQDLTGFEAFGEVHLHDRSSQSESR